MKQIRLPNPPDYMSYAENPLAYMRAMDGWMNRMKSAIETASAQNDTPLQQNFVVSSFTTSTELTGTSTLADLANFVCSLVQSMTEKGQITVKTSTGG